MNADVLCSILQSDIYNTVLNINFKHAAKLYMCILFPSYMNAYLQTYLIFPKSKMELFTCIHIEIRMP